MTHELERRYRESLRDRIEVLEDAVDRVEEGDSEAVATVRRVAHVLRGSGGTYGFPEISRAAEAAEAAGPEELHGRLGDLLDVLRGVAREEVVDGPEERALVLVVEDDPGTRLLIESALGQEDREVVGVERGDEATRVLESRDVDLVILDLFLPDTDGRNLLMRLRERPESAGLPVLVLSGKTAERTGAECMALGADGYLEKPVDPQALSAFVGAQLRRSARMERDARRDPLTGLPNQAALREEFEAHRDEPRTLVFIDLDRFQAVNDRHGRATGDRVLIEAAEAMRECVPDDGILSYWGDAKFAVVLPGTGEEGTEHAESCVQRLRKRKMEAPDGETFRVTASVAVVPAPVGAPLTAVLDEAERLVYVAKESGGNQTLRSEEDAAPPERTVLVAEDDDLTASILMHRFQKEGFRVRHYANGLSAFEGALEDPVSLVILDIKMPGMDGFELLEKLRSVPAYRDVPVILLSSMGSESDVVRGFELGADDYILKPFSPTELVARVRRILRQRSRDGARS